MLPFLGGLLLLSLISVTPLWYAAEHTVNLRRAGGAGTWHLVLSGVLAATFYHVLVLNQPEAELMGLFGIVALVVNVLAAAVLIPHRTGDANVRAVWLFSRNDAIGNAAVVVAAGLVTWTGTVWPDLVVALVIAGLFLHSSWSIIRDARADLREAR